jgi:hypothetical protein
MIKSKPHGFKAAILLAVAFVVAGVIAFFVPPIPQDLGYHDFADKRGWMGIPNFGDVVGNLPFAFAGLAGLWAVWKRRAAFTIRGEKALWTVFFAGAFVVCWGSGYYHWEPNNTTLIWDRLPMTVAFMSLFSVMIMERVSAKAGFWLFPFFLVGGILSVFYWGATEILDAGDMRPYAFVQFFPMLAILLMLWLFPARYTETRCLFHTLGWYVIAKILEHFDKLVFENMQGVISGHTVKHVAAAVGVFWVVRYILIRQPVKDHSN